MEDDNLEAFQRRLRAEIETQNNTPQDDFQGLSPTQVMGLNQQPLEEGCVLRWHDNIAPEMLTQVPLLTFATDLMDRLATKEIKLTAKGNLPGKLVKEWYATGLIAQYDIEEGITKLRSEDDFHAAATLKHLLNLLGWTKKRKGKLSLTAAGKKILAGPRQTMLEQLFLQHFTGFNLGYFDGYEDDGALQHLFGFVLVLLLQDGKDWRPVATYAEAMLRAYPMLTASFEPPKYGTPEKMVQRAFTIRFFDRSLSFYGLLRFRGKHHIVEDHREVMATDLCRSLFRLDLAATKPQPPGYEDAQIRTALFDAEMGGHSWSSGDLPPELQELFHEQVRAFHAADGAGRVAIGSLIPDLPIKAATSFANEEEAIVAVQEVLAALAEKYVIFMPPQYLRPTQVYQFLTTDFLQHEIPPPSELLPAFVPLEEVDSELAEPPAIVLAAEAFLIALLTLDEPLPEAMFHHAMRLYGEVVPRHEALAHANAWRSRWTAIRPLSFAPGPVQEADGFTYQFVQCAFETTDAQGATRTHEWTGVVQLIRVGEEWFTYGGSFQGEGEGFGF